MSKNFLEKAKLIENKLDELIQENASPYANLFKAARYSLLASGGKRLRPILLLTAVEDLGGCQDLAIAPACALEMIHTYSLIHDDLPCMDNDDFRRGKPTLHKVYPEWQALLAGDFLLTYAFEVLAEAPGLSSDQRIQLVKLFAAHAGSHGMVGGQVIDLTSVGKHLTLETLQLMHRLKTGALLILALQAAGVIAGVDDKIQGELKSYGEKMGLAYQIVDDILDVTAGKNSDATNDKMTYATLLGLEGAQKEADKLFKASQTHLSNMNLQSNQLATLATHFIYRSI